MSCSPVRTYPPSSTTTIPRLSQRTNPPDHPQRTPCRTYFQTTKFSTGLRKGKRISVPLPENKAHPEQVSQREKERRPMTKEGRLGGPWPSPWPGRHSCHSPLRSAAPPRMILATTTAPERSSRRMVAPCIRDRAGRPLRSSLEPQTLTLWTGESLPLPPLFLPLPPQEGQPSRHLAMLRAK